MKGLLALLAKPRADDEGAEGEDSGDGFHESAMQAYEALKSDDSEGFVDALKACIEMGAD